MTTLLDSPVLNAATIHNEDPQKSAFIAPIDLSCKGKEARALAVSIGVTLAAVATWGIGWGFMYSLQHRITPGPVEAAPVVEVLGPAGPKLDAAKVIHGRDLFGATCLACHGEEGQGRQGLGKDLVHSSFVRWKTDDMLVEFVKKGRDVADPLNTTKVPMPPKGNNPALTDADLSDIVTYVRALQDRRRVDAGMDLVAKFAPPEVRVPVITTAPGEDWYEPEMITAGAKNYGASCVSCHGPDAKGLPNLGKNLVTSEFVAKLDDEQFLAFIQKGRPSSDPLNTTKVDMPPKGGNPALDEDRINTIIAFIRTLQREASKSK